MAQTINIVLNAVAGGTVDVITATYSPALAAYTDKRILAFRATGANTSATPTFNANGLGAKTIVKKGGQPLIAGDIPAQFAIAQIQYDLANDRFELMNPASDLDTQTLSQVLTQGNLANMDIDMGGNNLTNVGSVVDSSGNQYLVFQPTYTAITTDAEGYANPFLYLENGIEASLGYDPSRGVQITPTYSQIIQSGGSMIKLNAAGAGFISSDDGLGNGTQMDWNSTTIQMWNQQGTLACNVGDTNVQHTTLIQLNAPDVRLTNELASKAIITDANSNLKTSVTTATELSYLSGATSNIQAQINALSSGWLLNGNTVGVEKFIGTLDNFDLPFRTNNIEVGRWTTGGRFKIGTGADTPVITNQLYVSIDGTAAMAIRDNTNNSEGYIQANGTSIQMGASTNHRVDIRSNNTNIVTIDTTGLGINITSPATPLDIRLNDSATTSTSNLITIVHTTSGTAGANFGSGMVWNLENAGNSITQAGLMETIWTTATAGSERSLISFKIRSATGMNSRLRLGAGGVVIGASGSVTPSHILEVRQFATSGGTAGSIIRTFGSAHTNLTAGSEYIDLNFDLARTVQFATGAIATQRATVYTAPTYSFVGASTITNAATLAISGSPVAGTNATITNPYSLWVQGGNSRMEGNLYFAGSLFIGTQTAAAFSIGSGNTARITFAGSGNTMSYIDGLGITLGSTSGTKIGTATSEKIGFWNTTPIVQPTTSVAAATFVANTSVNFLYNESTFDGYTVAQVVKALRNIGILA